MFYTKHFQKIHIDFTKFKNACNEKRNMVRYYQIERQLHSGFTYDVLLVMQARSGENEEDRKVRISCINIAFSVGNSFHWIFFLCEIF